jgi:hypothetical protein
LDSGTNSVKIEAISRSVGSFSADVLVHVRAWSVFLSLMIDILDLCDGQQELVPWNRELSSSQGVSRGGRLANDAPN